MAEDGLYEDVALGETMDRDAIADFLARAHTMASDYAFEWVSTQRSGHSYAAEWLASGTHDGPTALGLPPTGKTWTIRGVSIGQLDDQGRIKRHRDYWNLAGFLMQLGALPALAPAESAT